MEANLPPDGYRTSMRHRNAAAAIEPTQAHRGLRRAHVVGGLLFGLIVCPTAQATDARAVKLDRGGDGAVFVVYDRSCSEENYAECVVADLGCDAPGDLKASIIGLNAREAGAWLAKDAGKGTLKIGTERVPIAAGKLEFSDMNGNWDVSLSKEGDASGTWRRLATAPTVSISIANRTVPLPLAGPAKGAFRELLKICAPGAGKS